MWNRGGGPAYPHEKVVQFVFRHFPLVVRAQKRFLDLGCGSGVHTVFLARERFQVCGVDISPVGLEHTRRRLAIEGLSADLNIGSVEAVALPDASVDAVISVGVLDCAGPNLFAPALSELGRVLRPGGRAMLLFASDTDFRVAAAGNTGLHGFTQSEVEHALSPLQSMYSEVFMDRYITTYRNREIEQNDHLITLLKR